MAYKLKLIEWGLGSHVEIFEAEGIDDYSFPLLDEGTIQTIFKKCGPRLIFKKHFHDYLSRSNIREPETASINSQSDTNTIIFEPDDELLAILEDNNENQNNESAAEQAGPSSVISSPVFARADKYGASVEESVFPEGLELTLKKSTDGKLVLLSKDHLNNCLRQKLVRCMVNELIRIYGLKIRTDIFSRASIEIEKLFPKEQAESYFVPYIPPEKKRKIVSIEDEADITFEEERDRGAGPKGKLWNKYVNVRHSLNIANASKVVEQNKSLTVNDNLEGDVQEEHFLNFLKIAVEPFSKVLEAWENSTKLRRKRYLNAGLTEIYKDFPCLRLNSGIELIETDFNQRFPEKIDILYTTWPKVSTAILAEIKERKINVTNDTNCENTPQAILSLPYLCPPVMLKKSRKGNNWRPTRSEIQESFFSVHENFEELEKRIADRKQKLRDYGITLQPFATILGPLENPEGYYIIVDETKYKIGSSIRTLELLFKLYHALDIAYPSESEHIWLLIEELLFHMKPSKKLPSTSTAISDLRYYLEKKD